MSTTNLDSYDLKSAAVNGLISESVMKQIWDISQIPLPLTNLIGSDSHSNEYREWTQDSLSSPSLTNKTIDGADVDQDDSVVGTRVGNHSQTSVKEVKVSTRAIESDTIGRANELSYQVVKRQQELKRDIEASMLSNNPSIAGTDAVAGQSAGLNAWCETNVAEPASGYSAGGFNTGTGIVDAMTPGTSEALTEAKVRDTAQSVYEEGGNPTIFMAVPAVARGFSNYLFASTTVAQIQSDAKADSKGTFAQGAVNVFISDFGSVLEITPNRLQQNTTEAVGSPAANAISTAFLIDPMHLKLSYLHAPRVEPLAKTGLSEKRLMSCDYTLVVTTEKAQGAIPAIDNGAAVTA